MAVLAPLVTCCHLLGEADSLVLECPAHHDYLTQWETEWLEMLLVPMLYLLWDSRRCCLTLAKQRALYCE